MRNQPAECDELGELLKRSYEIPAPEPPRGFVQKLRTQLQQELVESARAGEAQVVVGRWWRPWAMGSAAALILALGLWLVVRAERGTDGTRDHSKIGSVALLPAEPADTSRQPSLTDEEPFSRPPPAVSSPPAAASLDGQLDISDAQPALLPGVTPETPRLAGTEDPTASAPSAIGGEPAAVAAVPVEAPKAFELKDKELRFLQVARDPVVPSANDLTQMEYILPGNFALLPIESGQAYLYGALRQSPPGRTTPPVIARDKPPSGSRRPDGEIVIEIEAFVDGKDYLIIRKNTVQWRHEAWAAVGRHEGFNEPTIISARKDGSTSLDRLRWFPEWCDWRGKPIPPRQTPSMSSVFAALTPPLPAVNMRVELTPLNCRNPVRVVQEPCADNSHTLIIGFDDTDLGATWYKLRLTVTEEEGQVRGETTAADRADVQPRGPLRIPGVVFVSDMSWMMANAGASNPVRRNININGRPIGIAGQVYAKGVWTHSYPDQTPADVVIDVSNRGFAAFLSDVGVEQSSDSGSVQFQVLVDEEKRAESPVMRPGVVHRFLVDVAGVKLVTLRVLNGGDGYASDHAAWGFARFVESGAPEPSGLRGRAASVGISDLAAYYPFDGDTKDHSGNGNHAVQRGGVTYADGVDNLAAGFDGVDDFIEISNSALLNSTSTIAFWVNLKESGDCSLVSKALLGNGYGVWLGRDANFNQGTRLSELISFGCDGAGVQWNWHMVTAETAIQPGQWHHVAAVVGDSGQRLYIDGREEASNPVAKTPQIDRPICLGRETVVGGGFLKGLLDEVRVFRRALSSEEVMRLYRKDAVSAGSSKWRLE